MSVVSEQEVIKLRSDVNSLYKVVFEGNGRPSLTNQVTQLSERIESLEGKIIDNINNIDSEMCLKFDNITAIVNERFANISAQISNEFERTKIKEASKYQHRTALVTAFIAAGSSFAVLLITHIFELAKH
jgi:hypothetical protein